MDGLVYRRVVNHRWKNAWENLSQSQKDAVLAQLDFALAEAGGRRYVLIACDAAYALKEWDTFGLEIFPDADAVRRYETMLDEIRWADYVETDSVTAAELAFVGLALCIRR